MVMLCLESLPTIFANMVSDGSRHVSHTGKDALTPPLREHIYVNVQMNHKKTALLFFFFLFVIIFYIFCYLLLPIFIQQFYSRGMQN